MKVRQLQANYLLQGSNEKLQKNFGPKKRYKWLQIDRDQWTQNQNLINQKTGLQFRYLGSFSYRKSANSFVQVRTDHKL